MATETKSSWWGVCLQNRCHAVQFCLSPLMKEIITIKNKEELIKYFGKPMPPEEQQKFFNKVFEWYLDGCPPLSCPDPNGKGPDL